MLTGGLRRPRLPHELVACIVLAAAAGVAAASTAGASGKGMAFTSGRPPAPGAGSPMLFLGTFADPRWAGEIRIDVSPDGRQVTGLRGIAPGPCDDRDFGRMLPGRDGATGAELFFYPHRSSKIRADGAFVASGTVKRTSNVPAQSVTLSGKFAGNTVRGRLEARTETSFDTCTANAAFTARRVLG